ncbi:MAG: class I adenylate-forming enzyme family protein, partial [Marmoricola sp.]
MAAAPHPADLRPGDRVALLVPGSARYVDVALSLLVRGIIPIPLDPRLTEAERAGILSSLDPTLVVTEVDDLEELALGWAPGQVPLARPMHVTSGTTGAPKGVHSGVLDPADAAALLAEERSLWGFNADDVNLVVGPLYHSAPLRFAIGTLLAGGRIVAPGAFDATALTAAIVEHRPTSMFVAPAHLQRLFAHWDAEQEAGGAWPDLSSFRLVAHAGAPCPDPLKRRLIQVFPSGSTWEFYGSTEGQFTACRSEEWLRRPGTVGRARPGRTLAVDEDGLIWCAV